MQREWGHTVDFLAVYLKEAHPDDEWRTADNESDGICYNQPKSLRERLGIARDFLDSTNFEIPLLIDTMENEALEDYAAWPERLYVLSAKGQVMFVGGLGPALFDPERVEEWLEDHLGSRIVNHATTPHHPAAVRD